MEEGVSVRRGNRTASTAIAREMTSESMSTMSQQQAEDELNHLHARNSDDESADDASRKRGHDDDGGDADGSESQASAPVVEAGAVAEPVVVLKPLNSESIPRECRGFTGDIFAYLHAKTVAKRNCMVRIPDTIVFSSAGRPHAWFFTSAQTGQILRKNKANTTSELILEALLKRKDPVSEIVAVFYGNNYPSDGVSITYLEEESLRAFLLRGKKPEGVLQRFIDPLGPSQCIIQATWTPRLFLLEQRTNKNKLNDKKISMYERAVTYEGAEFQSTTVGQISATTNEGLRRVCATIARHLYYSSLGPLAARVMTIHFKIGRDNRLYLLWMPTLRLSLEQIPEKPAPLASGMIRAATTTDPLDRTMRSGSSAVGGKVALAKAKIAPCPSCQETFDVNDLYPVTYKSIMRLKWNKPRTGDGRDDDGSSAASTDPRGAHRGSANAGNFVSSSNSHNNTINTNNNNNNNNNSLSGNFVSVNGIVGGNTNSSAGNGANGQGNGANGLGSSAGFGVASGSTSTLVVPQQMFFNRGGSRASSRAASSGDGSPHSSSLSDDDDDDDGDLSTIPPIIARSAPGLTASKYHAQKGSYEFQYKTASLCQKCTLLINENALREMDVDKAEFPPGDRPKAKKRASHLPMQQHMAFNMQLKAMVEAQGAVPTEGSGSVSGRGPLSEARIPISSAGSGTLAAGGAPPASGAGARVAGSVSGTAVGRGRLTARTESHAATTRPPVRTLEAHAMRSRRENLKEPPPYSMPVDNIESTPFTAVQKGRADPATTRREPVWASLPAVKNAPRPGGLVTSLDLLEGTSRDEHKEYLIRQTERVRGRLGHGPILATDLDSLDDPMAMASGSSASLATTRPGGDSGSGTGKGWEDDDTYDHKGAFTGKRELGRAMDSDLWEIFNEAERALLQNALMAENL